MTNPTQDNNEANDIVVQFVISCRAKGHFLPYQDYEIIQRWIDRCPDVDELLLILDHQLPPFFKRFEERRMPPPGLKSIDKKICTTIDHLSKRASFSETSLTP